MRIAMDATPLVSVIVPNYNYGRFLPRCLDSLRAQTYPNLDVLIMDGGSTDNSLAIMESYARTYPMFRFRSERDKGPANAINKGIGQTSGAFLTWLNSDDALDSRAIESAMAALQQDDRLALVYGSVVNVTEGGEIVALNRGLSLAAGDLAVFDFIPQAGAVFKRYDGLYLDETLEWGFDWALWIELSKRGGIRNLNRIVGSCIVMGQACRKSDMIIPRRTLELARIARRCSPKGDIRIMLAYLAAGLGYALMPLRFIDANYHVRIVRWVGRLQRLVCGASEKGIML